MSTICFLADSVHCLTTKLCHNWYHPETHHFLLGGRQRGLKNLRRWWERCASVSLLINSFIPSDGSQDWKKMMMTWHTCRQSFPVSSRWQMFLFWKEKTLFGIHLSSISPPSPWRSSFLFLITLSYLEKFLERFKVNESFPVQVEMSERKEKVLNCLFSRIASVSSTPEITSLTRA